jgi:uncharacterized cupredoxin-like copper-binding protein
MKQLTLFSLIILSALILTACGGPSPAAEPTAAAEATSMPDMPSQPAATASVPAATQGNPVQAPPPVDPATRVEVNLRDNTISSSLTSFKAGVPYTFVVTNNGRHEHNFNITAPVAEAGGYSEALTQALLSLDDTQLGPGSTTTVEFTFPESAVGASLEFNCLIRRHYEDGMFLAITVTA